MPISNITNGEAGSDVRTSLNQAIDFINSLGTPTTVGESYLNLANPSAITFPRMNADNSVSALSATDFKTAIGATNNTTVMVGAAAMIPRTTTGCGVNSFETSTNKINYDTLDFDPGTIEHAQFLIMLPSNWDAGTVTAQFLWTAQSGSGDVVWTLAARSLANDDPIDSAMGSAQSSTDTLTAAGDMDISASTSAITIGGTPAVGSPIYFQVSRNATSGSDTLAVDANLIGVLITFGVA